MILMIPPVVTPAIIQAYFSYQCTRIHASVNHHRCRKPGFSVCGPRRANHGGTRGVSEGFAINSRRDSKRGERDRGCSAHGTLIGYNSTISDCVVKRLTRHLGLRRQVRSPINAGVRALPRWSHAGANLPLCLNVLLDTCVKYSEFTFESRSTPRRLT